MANSAIGALGALASLPAGSLVDFAGTFAPSGWIMCDGSAISRATYSTLFLAIGIAYGSGDGSTTFNLPDFRGRFARFNDNMGTTAGAAGRDVGRILGTNQTQATAKNGLQNAASGVTTIAAGDHTHVVKSDRDNRYPIRHRNGGTLLGFVMPDFGTNDGTNSMYADTAGSHSHTGTATAQDITGDTETRPINLSCNRIIKY